MATDVVPLRSVVGSVGRMSYDVAAVRAQFPALRSGTAHFDGPGGTQVPEPVARAVAETLTSSIANRGRVTAAERLADDVVLGARSAVADLLGADPRGVVFGRSATQLTFDLARTLAAGWGPGDEVVVSRLDHDANVRPWVRAAEAVGATVRWAAFDPATGELTADDVAEVLTERTKLVAVTGASNLIGTRPAGRGDRRAGARGGRAARGRRRPPDRARAGRRPARWAPTSSPARRTSSSARTAASWPPPRRCWRRCAPAKLLPSSDDVPERFELGTLPYELLAGTTAAVDFLAGLGDGTGTAARAAARGDGRCSRSTRTGCASTSRPGWPSCPACASGRGPRTARRPCCSPSTGTRPPTRSGSSPSAA